MPRSNPLAESFSTGELSPRLSARLTFPKYPAGLESCVNLVPLAEGGVLRRTGSRHIADVEDHTVKSRLLPFQFSTEQAYILEFGDRKLHFFRNQSQITTNVIGNAIQNGSFVGSIANWSDVSTGAGSFSHDATNDRLNLIPGGATASDIGWAEQRVQNSITIENVLKFRVLGAPSDKIQLRIGTSSSGNELVDDVEFEVGYHVYAFTPTAADFYVQFRNLGSFRNKTVQIDTVSTTGDAPLSLDTLYDEADLPSLRTTQSADVLYIFLGAEPTHKLLRVGSTSWSLVEVAWQDGPWLEVNTTTTTLTPSATTGVGITLTASSKVGINDGGGFTVQDIGRSVRIDNPVAGVDWGWGVITAQASTTSVTLDVRRDFAATTADVNWRLGAWSQPTGYPQNGTFYQQRLLGAATSDEPQTFDASNTSDFEVFSPDSEASGVWDGTVEDDDSFRYAISADEVNAIRWLSAGNTTLIIGTTGGEWSVSSTGSVITPTDVVVERETTFGSADVESLRVSNVVLFVQRAKRKIREFGVSPLFEGFQAVDMTRLAQHITLGGIVQMDYAEEPDAVVWVVREDGVLLSMTFRREEDVVGWSRHTIGGSFSGGDAVVESVATIPGTDGAGQIQDSTDRDEVWLSVKRTIDGATVRYVEVLEGEWETGDDQEDAYYSDSLITYDGAAASTITGLTHLEGETVKVFADGAVHPDRTVASGQITLDDTYSVVQVGLGYTHTLKTLKIVTGTVAGTSLGRTKRVNGITFVLLNSLTIGFGPDPDDTDTWIDIDFREVEDLMDTGVPFYTGEFPKDKPIGFDDIWGSDPRVYVQSDDPAPFGLLAMALETDTKELK